MKTTAIVILILITGCAGYRPIVDMQNVNPGKYETDLKECQVYAEQVSPAAEGATGAAIGAGIGAVLGAVVGSFIGEAGRGAAMGAAIGGTQGAVQGTGGGLKGQVDIIRNCMAQRGYRILR
jgi:outer membrane lipoprotein SlyB